MCAHISVERREGEEGKHEEAALESEAKRWKINIFLENCYKKGLVKRIRRTSYFISYVAAFVLSSRGEGNE